MDIQSSWLAACEQEIHELHRFFQAWFRGELPEDDISFERLESALADDFVIITPTGRLIEGSPLIDGLRAQYGSWSRQQGRIWIENVQPRRQFEENGAQHALLTYEEWQKLDGEARGRLSTVLMRGSASVPNRVEWLHLHEVWLPSEGADGTPSTIASDI